MVDEEKYKDDEEEGKQYQTLITTNVYRILT